MLCCCSTTKSIQMWAKWISRCITFKRRQQQKSIPVILDFSTGPFILPLLFPKDFKACVAAVLSCSYTGFKTEHSAKLIIDPALIIRCSQRLSFSPLIWAFLSSLVAQQYLQYLNHYSFLNPGKLKLCLGMYDCGLYNCCRALSAELLAACRFNKKTL